MKNSKNSISILCPGCKSKIQWSHTPVMRSTVFYKCPHCGSLLNSDTINSQLGRNLPQSTLSGAIVGLVTIISSVVVALIAALIYYFVGHGLDTIIVISILVVLGIAISVNAYLKK